MASRGVRNIDRLLQLLIDTHTQLPELARDAWDSRSPVARSRCPGARHRGGAARMHRSNAASRRLATIPGIGPITANAIAATVVDASQFSSGRQFAAWLGLVPQQRSSGGKERLRGISKRGDGYLRRLLIHGARAIVGWRKRSARTSDRWINVLPSRRPINVATPRKGERTSKPITSCEGNKVMADRLRTEERRNPPDTSLVLQSVK